MKVELEKVISIDGVSIAALAQRITHCSKRAGTLAVCGGKRPIAVLIRRHGLTVGFEVDGKHIAPDEFELRYPGQRAAFELLTNIKAEQS